MNFKRGRAKNQRAGCLLCKPFKMNGAKGVATLQVRRADASMPEQMECAYDSMDEKRKFCGMGDFTCNCCLSCLSEYDEYLLDDAMGVFGDWPTSPKIATQLSELFKRAA